jgi:predicted Zn finger-like uncharacterized protein
MERHVPQLSFLEPLLTPIERPRCPNCQTRMMVVRIEARPAGADLRTFGCRHCKNVHKALADDPLKSDKAGWLNSALRPPE